LAIGKKYFDHIGIKIVFELKGNRIECENDVKLLGVTIDYELKFDKHISDICKQILNNIFDIIVSIEQSVIISIIINCTIIYNIKNIIYNIFK
jgi:hypothetical protein